MSGDALVVGVGLITLGGGIGFGAYCLTRMYHAWLEYRAEQQEVNHASRNG